MSFLCPVCKSILISDYKTLKCPNSHCFDIAKEGYVNLAAVKGASEVSGDTKQMCLDRRSFLESGFYSPLAQELSNVIKEHKSEEKLTVIDAGCGEGYYSRQMRHHLGSGNQFYGIDLAKEAIRLASKCEKTLPKEQRIKYAVSGIFDLPFADNFADVLVSVFAPIADKEFARVLKNKGLFVVVCPGANHLYGLKSALYDTARKNEEKIPEYEDFNLIDTRRKTYNITVEGSLISSLFGMTPYYWKSSREVHEKAKMLTNIETECDFLIKVYRLF